MHKPLRTREDILDFAARHAPSNACARAIREGTVEIFPYLKGWRLNIESRLGGRWYLYICGNDGERCYRVTHATPTTPEPETSTGLRGHADGQDAHDDSRVQMDQDREESRQAEDDSVDENRD